jgi:hypothetical protein
MTDKMKILLSLARVHAGRGDDCGRLARIVIETLPGPAVIPPVALMSDDDVLRFACRCLESNPPESDKQSARAGLQAIRARFRALPEPMQWPKARDLFLRDDMGLGQLRVLFDSDNDVCVAIWPEGATSAAVEFCNGGGGGGKSPNTRAALIALMVAMEKDGAKERPIE